MRKKSKKIIVGIYKELVVNKYKSQSFWVLGSFIPSFLVIRLTVHLLPNVRRSDRSGIQLNRACVGVISGVADRASV